VPHAGASTIAIPNIPPELRDRRDWDAIEAWAQQIARALQQHPAASEGPPGG